MDFGLGVLLEAKDIFSGTFNRAGMAFRDFEGATSAAGKRITDNLKGMGTALGIFAAGAGGLALLSTPIGVARDLGVELGQIQTIANEAAFSTNAAKAAAMGLADAYGIGGIKAAGAEYEILSAGITDAAKATELLNVASEASIGGRAELKPVIDVLTSAVNTYADSNLSAREASDSLFQAVNAGKTTMAQLSHSLGEVAPTAHALGISFDELNASIATLTVLGVKTPQAVTGLNAMMANIAKPTREAAAEAARLGIQFDATALKTLGFKGVLDQLSNNAKVNDNTFVNLFGSIDGIKSALTLTANGGAKFSEVLEMMKAKTGATAAALDIMKQKTQFQEDRFKALKENAQALIGEALEPMYVSILRFGASIAKAFNEMSPPVRDFLVRGFALASVLLTLVGGALAVKAAIGIVSAGLAAAGVTASSFLASLAPVLVVVGLIAGAFYMLKEAYDRNLGGMADAVNRVVAAVKLIGGALGQAFEQGGFSGAIMEELNKAENSGIKNFVVRVYVAVARLQELFSKIGEGFSAAIAAAGPTFDALLASVHRIGEAFSGLWAALDPTSAAETFDAFGAGGTKIGTILGRVAVAVTNVFTVALDIVGGFISALSPVGELLGLVIDTLGEVFSEIGDVIGELALFDNAVDGTASGWVAFGQTLGNVVAVAAELVKSLVRTVGGALKAAVNIIGGVLDLFSGNFDTGIKRILYGIVSLIGTVILGAIELVATASDALFGTHWAENVAGWRKSLDETLRQGFDIPGARKPGGGEAAPVVTPTGSLVAPGRGAGEPEYANLYASVEAMSAPAAPDNSELFARLDALKEPKPSTLAVKLNIDGEDLRSKLDSASMDANDRSFGPGIPIASY